MSNETTPPEGSETTHTSDRAFHALPTRIGNYRLLRKLGEGGMGEVWEAEQEKPVRRKVALKLIKWGLDTRAVVARFEAERQALALMNHPNVAKVFDAGTTERGRPYFVMELVKGEPITQHCDRQRLTTKERLELFIDVCEGVQHAHHKGIIHRDVKPSNILVQVEGEKRTPKIIDFGVAKATQQRLTEHTVFTELGQLIGTPEYMSPEQAEMTVEDIDTRTDVYSLGVLLYELLVGALPFDPAEFRRAGFDEIRRRIREEEPHKPSTRISTLGEVSAESARRRRTDPAALARQLRGDLDWITMKALEKDRSHRYQSPREFSSDVSSHLVDEPIKACPPRLSYRARKLFLRHRLAVSVSLLGLLAMMLGLVIMTALYLRAERSERRAIENRERAVRQSYLANLRAADLSLSVNDTDDARKRLTSCPREERRWEWYHLWHRSESSVAVLDGAFARFVDGSSTIRTFSLPSIVNDWTGIQWSQRSLSAISPGRRPPESVVAVGNHGKHLISCGSESLKCALVFVGTGESKTLPFVSPEVVRNPEPESGELLQFTTNPAVVFSPDDSAFAVCRPDGKSTVDVYTVDDQKMIASLPTQTESVVTSMAFSRDTTLMGVGYNDGEIQVWEIEADGLKVALHGPEDTVTALCFNSSGNGLSTGHRSGIVRFWDLASARMVDALPTNHNSVRNLTFTRDDSTMLTAGRGRTIMLWDVDSLARRSVLNAPRTWVSSLAVEPGGRWAVSSTYPMGPRSKTRVWDLSSTEAGKVLTMAFELYSIAITPQGEHAIVGTGNDSVLMLSLSAGFAVTRLRNTQGASYHDLRFSPVDLRNPTRETDRPVYSVVSVPLSNKIIAGGARDSALIWSTDTVTPVGSLPRHERPIGALAVSPEGDRVVSGTWAGRLRVFSIGTSEEIASLDGHRAPVRSVAFTPSGSHFVSGDASGRIVVWQAPTLNPTRTIETRADGVTDLAISPDGHTVVTGMANIPGSRSAPTLAMAWQLPHGTHLANLAGVGRVSAVTFTPDGERVAVAKQTAERSSIQIWSTGSFELLIDLEVSEVIRDMAFTPDGRRLVSVGGRTLRFWDTAAPSF